ncbi:MAG TPA: PqqD family peptide modification chaperone, partial [Gammaproteobacteria bacterium]|nr:PqqD family peptide modification chaperone [Gammaproteobacteria bacterium]
MPERLKDQSIPILQRQTLLSALPCFSTLTVQDTKALAVLFYEVQYAAGDVITIEEALIDNVYIIVTGEAEVTRNVISKHPITKKNKITKVPVAELSSGEAIGLNDAGFFSTTGKRTATVTALSDMLVLALDIEQLHQFLQEHAHFLSEMYDVTEKMLRMRLIKQSLPFSRLSHSRLEWLASQIEDIAIPAGAVLFRQGDIGDRCYLIRSGQIEIVMQEKDNSEHQLAILKSPTLFGEATLITHSPRNATARAIDNCELLVLRHEHLSELIETERNVADMFMTLMVDRSRPMRNVDITAHPRKTADGQEVIILKNALTGTYFKLSDEGWFIWQELDGKKTLQEITLALAEKFSIFSPDTVAGLISKLAKAGFIYNLEVNEEAHFAAQPIWVRMLLRLRRILEAKIA